MNNLVQLQKIPFQLNKLIEKEGILNYVNDYYVSVNGNFNMLYATVSLSSKTNLTNAPIPLLILHSYYVIVNNLLAIHSEYYVPYR